jgi:hypothetical protein
LSSLATGSDIMDLPISDWHPVNKGPSVIRPRTDTRKTSHTGRVVLFLGNPAQNGHPKKRTYMHPPERSFLKSGHRTDSSDRTFGPERTLEQKRKQLPFGSQPINLSSIPFKFPSRVHEEMPILASPHSSLRAISKNPLEFGKPVDGCWSPSEEPLLVSSQGTPHTTVFVLPNPFDEIIR